MYLRGARDEALVELYLQSMSQPPASYPSDAEVQAAYDARPVVSEVPAQHRLAQIFIAAPRAHDTAADEATRVRLAAVVAKLEAKGADFGAVARADSDEHPAAENGGEIGWSSEAQLVPGIRAAVMGLTKGSVSAPVRLDDGWHIIKLLDTRPASRSPLPEIRPTLVAQLRAERAQALRRAYLAKLLDDSPPAINELALTGLVAKTK